MVSKSSSNFRLEQVIFAWADCTYCIKTQRHVAKIASKVDIAPIVTQAFMH